MVKPFYFSDSENVAFIGYCSDKRMTLSCTLGLEKNKMATLTPKLSIIYKLRAETFINGLRTTIRGALSEYVKKETLFYQIQEIY